MLELTTSLIIFVSAFSAASGIYDRREAVSTFHMDSAKAVVLPMTLEQYVREYYKNTPILAEIARCESQFRQFRTNGKVIRGKENPADVGIMQINEYYHREKAKTIGFDLYSLEGNIAYAEYLFEREGGKPWSASAKCWNSQPFKSIALLSQTEN